MLLGFLVSLAAATLLFCLAGCLESRFRPFLAFAPRPGPVLLLGMLVAAYLRLVTGEPFDARTYWAALQVLAFLPALLAHGLGVLIYVPRDAKLPASFSALARESGPVPEPGGRGEILTLVPCRVRRLGVASLALLRLGAEPEPSWRAFLSQELLQASLRKLGQLMGPPTRPRWTLPALALGAALLVLPWLAMLV